MELIIFKVMNILYVLNHISEIYKVDQCIGDYFRVWFETANGLYGVPMTMFDVWVLVVGGLYAAAIILGVIVDALQVVMLKYWDEMYGGLVE